MRAWACWLGPIVPSNQRLGAFSRRNDIRNVSVPHRRPLRNDREKVRRRNALAKAAASHLPLNAEAVASTRPAVLSINRLRRCAFASAVSAPDVPMSAVRRGPARARPACNDPTLRPPPHSKSSGGIRRAGRGRADARVRRASPAGRDRASRRPRPALWISRHSFTTTHLFGIAPK